MLIDCFLCNSYPCVLFESFSHVINQESCLFVKFGENLPCSFLIFWNFARFTREISKFQKSELDKFISNLALKHVITSTNLHISITCKSNRFHFVDDKNISTNFLYKDDLHLLYSSKELLAKNFCFNTNNFLRKQTYHANIHLN